MTDSSKPQSEEYFSLLVGAVQDYAICGLDPDGRILTWNEGTRRLKQYAPEEIIGSHFSLFYTPEEIARRLPEQELEDAARNGRYEKIGWRIRKDGTRFWGKVVITALKNTDGQLKGFAKTTEEVTSREQLKTLADSISQIVWMTDSNVKVEYYNKRWFDFTGLTEAESMDMTIWRKVIHPDDFPQIQKAWAVAVANKVPFEAEWRMKAKDGSYYWHLARTVPAFGANRQLVAWYGTSTDIHDKKIAVERLRENEKQFRILAEASALFAQSLNYEMTLQSLADVIVKAKLADWCSIAILDHGKAPRQAAAAHPDPERLKLVQELFKDYPTDWNAKQGAPQVLRTGKTELYKDISPEILKASAQDSRHLELLQGLQMRSAMVVPLVARGKVLGTITFIAAESGQLYTEQNLALAEEIGRRAGIAVDNGLLFAEAQRAIQVRDEFLSIASHELKTPLTTLKLQAQIRKRNLEMGNVAAFGPERLAMLLDGDERQIARLTRLIDDMLDVSRLNLGKFLLEREKMDVCTLVGEVVERFQPQLQAGNTAVTLDAPCPVIGRWDKYRLEQIITNLLTNAVKYGAGKPIHVVVYKDAEGAKLSVRDQGIGIGKDDQARIFQQFERAKSPANVSGLGLGLYIAKQIAEAHGGDIRVESEVGVGSAFTLILPMDQ